MDFGDSSEQERTSELIPVDGVESSILRKVSFIVFLTAWTLPAYLRESF